MPAPARTGLSPCLLGVLLLTACGGGGSGSSGSGSAGASATPAPGALLQSPPDLIASVSVASLLLDLNGSTDQQLQQLLSLVGAPLCDIALYHLQYETVGALGEPTSASGALMVPTGNTSGCSGSRPIVLYAHGTSTERNYNIADLTNQQNAEGLLLAAVFASQGYIVAAPNYAGYDTSTLPYTAYLIADQQSTDLIDALQAARSALPVAAAATTTDAGKLFVTGYSQGGYVALATQRAMEAAGMTVTASAPMSGPYALAAFVDAVFEGEVDGGAPVVATLLFTAYQRAYGTIYASASEAFSPQYASGIGSLFPSTLPRSQLYAEGKLPQYALFSSTPPAPAYADLTPATTPTTLAPVFALGFGSGNLFNNSYRLSYLQDAQAHPDGGFPMVTSGLPADAPSNPMRVALKQNDLRGFTPRAPVLLCGGDEDPEVFWFNAQLEQASWGAQASSSSSVLLDLDAASSSGDAYSALRTGFEAAKTAVAVAAIAQGATDGGYAAVEQAYHTTLVPPFCLTAVKAFFDAH